jgi:hypothetical protein
VRTDSSGPGGRAAQLAALLVALGMCLPAAAFAWPWHHHATRAAASTPSVHAIAVTLGGASAGAGTTATAIGQAWDRNTLLLDLTAQGGQGGATLTRLPGAGWPARLELRVRPGKMGRLTVDGAQRVVFSIPPQGAPLILKLDPGVYVTDTASVTLQWSEAGD